jgi:hypothetical protein
MHVIPDVRCREFFFRLVLPDFASCSKVINAMLLRSHRFTVNHEFTCLCWKTIIFKHLFHLHTSGLDNTQHLRKPFSHLPILAASSTQNRACHDPALRVIPEVLGFHQPPSSSTAFPAGASGGGGGYRTTNLIFQKTELSKKKT